MTFPGMERFRGMVDQDHKRRFWEEVDSGEDDPRSVEEILDQHWADVISDHDPLARLPRRLDIRLAGPRVISGAIDIRLTEAVLQAFTRELDGAAEANSLASSLSAALVGIGRGSAVLKLVPTTPENIPAEDQVPAVVDPFDTVVQTLTDLHGTAEEGGDLSRFADSDRLLRGLHGLAKTLDEYNLVLDLCWRSGTGRRRSSRLGEAGRRRVLELWEQTEATDEIIVSGRVVTLDLNGTFSVKTAAHRTAKRYLIHVDSEEALMRLDLRLGAQVHVRVRSVRHQNQVGIEGSSRYEFAGWAAQEPQLVEDNDT
jgi:hypothetical protein